jgi:hypothetical protein
MKEKSGKASLTNGLKWLISCTVFSTDIMTEDTKYLKSDHGSHKDTYLTFKERAVGHTNHLVSVQDFIGNDAEAEDVRLVIVPDHVQQQL